MTAQTRQDKRIAKLERELELSEAEIERLGKVVEQALGLIAGQCLVLEPVPNQGCVAVTQDTGEHVCFHDGPELAAELRSRETPCDACRTSTVFKRCPTCPYGEL